MQKGLTSKDACEYQDLFHPPNNVRVIAEDIKDGWGRDLGHPNSPFWFVFCVRNVSESYFRCHFFPISRQKPCVHSRGRAKDGGIWSEDIFFHPTMSWTWSLRHWCPRDPSEISVWAASIHFFVSPLVLPDADPPKADWLSVSIFLLWGAKNALKWRY